LRGGGGAGAVAMFRAMGCAAVLLLNLVAKVGLAGLMSPVVAGSVEECLGRKVVVYDEWCAARGLVKIARDVFTGTDEILGLAVDL